MTSFGQMTKRPPKSSVYKSRLSAFWWLLVCFGLSCLLSISYDAHSQSISKEELTASYVYNFAKNIEWPDEEARTAFTIALYRVDNPLLAQALLYLNNNFRVHGKPIKVVRANTLKSLAKYQLVFTEQVGLSTINNIYGVLEGRPTLLVTNGLNNKQLVMINLSFLVDRRMVFEVNKSNIINQGLKPLPELILNGGTEIDVAALFREGQASLIVLQKQLKSRETILDELIADIHTQEQHNKNLEQRLNQLSRNIRESRQLISDQADRLQLQREQIDLNTQERKLLLEEVAQSHVDLEKQRAKLLIRQKQLEKIGQNIGEREQRLSQLNSIIQQQESQISQQMGEITELDELVSSQKTALSYFKVIVVLAILLVNTAFIAYMIKRRDNKRLAAHSHDLQMAQDRLSIAKQKAEEASAAKSEFLSLMTHELRTPLQAIIGYTDVVLEELKINDEMTHADDLTRVINNSERLLRLINNVLDMAKLESGQMELHLTEVKLSTLVEEAVDNVKPQIEKNLNKLTVIVKEGLIRPIADPEKLVHIMINLLSNSAKFTERGTISIKVVHSQNSLDIDVEDSGIGMTAKQQIKIFERFGQADSSATRNFQGSGLGLSIASQLLAQMGGSIKVDSEFKRGSLFHVSIPLPIPLLNESDSPTLEENIIAEGDVNG